MAKENARNSGNGGKVGNEVDPQECTLQDYFTPIVEVRSNILLPNLGEQNCKLRHGLINMIEKNAIPWPTI